MSSFQDYDSLPGDTASAEDQLNVGVCHQAISSTRRLELSVRARADRRPAMDLDEKAIGRGA